MRGRIWHQVPALQEDLVCSNLFYTPFSIDGGAENLQIEFIDSQYQSDLNEKLNSFIFIELLQEYVSQEIVSGHKHTCSFHDFTNWQFLFCEQVFSRMKYLKCLQDRGSVSYWGGLIYVGTSSVVLDSGSFVHRSVVKSHIDILVLQVKDDKNF